ncbi:MAG: hypothetical protein P8Z68_08230 [Kineosporiaceae bacterium]|jgi:hypothetical protein
MARRASRAGDSAAGDLVADDGTAAAEAGEPSVDGSAVGGAEGTGSSAEEASDLLADLMRAQRRRWAAATKAYGAFYYVNRVTLLLASAIVAARDALSTGIGDFLVPWVPLLAVSVVVLIAVDMWLKPYQKWRGVMDSRDGLADLLVRRAGGLPMERTRAEFLALRQRHRERNLF